VVGFDLSQDRFRVATIGADKVSYLVHDVPAAMCFVGKERFIGENTAGREGLFYDIMKLVGKSFDDLSSDLNLRRHVKKSDGNLLCLCLPSLDMECHYTPTHLLAMFFSKMKCLAEEHLGPQVAILGFCIGVPAYFTKLQCLAIRQAAEIAGLHGVSFMSATTATALASCVTAQHRWPEGEHVAVVSISSKNTEVTIAHLDEKNKLVVSSYTCDLHLGEDDFINVLRGHYQEKECKEIIKISKRMGSKTTLKFSGREKTREEIAEICKPLLDRMNGLVEQAVEKAMLGEKGIKAIELAGSGCDMFFVSSALRDHFHLTPTNAWKIAREGVAMGCAMNCAILQHKEFNLRLGDFSDKEANDKLSLLNRNVRGNP
jgi:heat shock protein